MVMENVRRCDVFGTLSKVAGYKVSVVKITVEDAEGGTEVVETNVFDAGPVDLSARAYKRLVKCVTAGCKPPTPRREKAEKGGADAETR